MSETQRVRRRPQPSQDLPTTSRPPDHMGTLFASMLLMIAGWGGLIQLIMTTRPRIGGEIWLFFALLQIAVTGTAIPIVRYFNVRFTPVHIEVPPAGVIVRQSVWVGLLVCTYWWLLIPRVLSLSIAFFLILFFVVIEIFLRSRELANER
jgi:hypothetical protein